MMFDVEVVNDGFEQSKMNAMPMNCTILKYQ